MKVILKNGQSFNAELNGNNYITQEDVSGFDFSVSNCKKISIDGAEYVDMKCTNVFTQQDGTHVIFHHRTPQELADEKTKSNIDYIAMMTEVDLDD